MATGATNLERLRITQLADEYRRRGYSVVIEPQLDEVPAFIKPYRPDLIAKGPDETVVVEVKAGPRSTADLVPIASAINSRPGWRFELVLVETETTPAGKQLMAVEELERGLPEIDRLISAGLLPSAFVLLWATTEGALRHAARRQGLTDELQPARLLRQLTSLGVITQKDLQFLERCISVRNNVAHGFQPDTLDRTLLNQLRAFTQRLLEAGESIDDSFTFQNVSKWVSGVLTSFQEFRLDDHVFDRDAVIVRAPDDAEFLVTMESWTDMDATERSDQLRTALVNWADEHVPKRS